MATANELLKKLPALFNGEADKTTKAVFQINVAQPCYVHIENGKAEVIDGQAPNGADLTLTASDENLIKVLKGQVNGMFAVVTGQLKVQGNMMLATKMTSLFDMSKL